MTSIAPDVGHTVCRPWRQVERRAGRVEHAADDTRAAEPVLRDLGDHDVGVVAVGGDHRSVGVADPRLDQHVDVEAVADARTCPASPRPAAARASGSSSTTVTSWPSSAICAAILEPTRPQPTISSFMAQKRTGSGARLRRHRRALCRIVPACPRPQRPPSACSASAPSARPCTGCCASAPRRSSGSPAGPSGAARPRARPRPPPRRAAGLLTTDFAALRDDPAVSVVAEVMGGVEPTRRYVLELLGAGKSVVSANKQLLARHGEELFAAAERNGVQLRFEASVCAAIPVVKVLRESMIVTNVHGIDGIVNGTTNFILTRMVQGGAPTPRPWRRHRSWATPRPTRPRTSPAATPPPRSRSWPRSPSTPASGSRRCRTSASTPRPGRRRARRASSATPSS